MKTRKRSMSCKYCGEIVRGTNIDMAVHVRHRCEVKKATREGQKVVPNFDPDVALNNLVIQFLDAVQKEISRLESRIEELKGLLERQASSKIQATTWTIGV